MYREINSGKVWYCAYVRSLLHKKILDDSNAILYIVYVHSRIVGNTVKKGMRNRWYLSEDVGVTVT